MEARPKGPTLGSRPLTHPPNKPTNQPTDEQPRTPHLDLGRLHPQPLLRPLVRGGVGDEVQRREPRLAARGHEDQDGLQGGVDLFFGGVGGLREGWVGEWEW